MRARFHLPDFAGHFKFNVVYAEFLKAYPQYFREGVEIASVYGAFPPSMWNGGRTQDGISSRAFIKAVTEAFNERGIPLRFTFTNPMLEKQHLHDEFCNSVMHIADNGMNEVIVLSPLLEEYIRKIYPNYKITSSTCKRILEPDQLYSELEKDYHIVVIDYDLNHDFETLKRIPDKSKCELLVNACCQPNCPNRQEHYRTIGLQQIAYAEYVKKHKTDPPSIESLFPNNAEFTKLSGCPYPNKTLWEITQSPNHISPDEIWNTYIPMGFEQFKIEGRSAHTFTLIEHYLYYMAKPECRDEARYMLLKMLELNEVLTINE